MVTRPDLELTHHQLAPGITGPRMCRTAQPGRGNRMKEDFLATQSLDAPRVRWNVYRDANCYLTCIIGGQAPSWR